MNKIICGDVVEVLKTLSSESIDCCITSPPYWRLRDYGVDGQIGLEKTPEEYVAKMVEVFREVKRVLKKEGVMFLNLGDSYATHDSKGKNAGQFGQPVKEAFDGISTKRKTPAKEIGLKEKDLVGIPWRVAFALQACGWYLRQDLIWMKPNPMPESVQGSHFYRHRVIIEKYEELQRVWKTKSINQDRPSDLSDLSQGKISDSKITLHEKPERNSDSKSERATPGSKREKKPILGYKTSTDKQSEVFGESERDGELSEESGKLSGTTSEGGGSRNGTGLDGHSGAPSLSLFLLQPEKFQNDSRPQNPIEQRREKLAREHSTSLPQVQLHKEGQNRMDSEEIDCPGCYMCENQNGFIFTLLAGRCTKSHEYIFLMAKSPKYYFDNEAIKEKSVCSDPRMVDGFVPKSVNGKHKDDMQNSAHRKQYKPTEAGGGTSMVNHEGYFKADGTAIGTPGYRNKRDVWTVTTSPFPEAHFATFPEDLIVPMVKAGCPKDGICLDPFMGAGTTAVVARKLGRKYLGIEINPEYIKIAEKRLSQQVLF